MSKKKAGAPETEVKADATVEKPVPGIMTPEEAIARGLDPVPFGGAPE